MLPLLRDQQDIFRKLIQVRLHGICIPRVTSLDHHMHALV